MYRGQWLNGKRDGKGIEMRCNYQMIVGYFKEGEMHGPQTSISIWGTKTAVTYKNGQMEGPCVKSFLQGPPLTQMFKNGKELGMIMIN